MHLKTFHAPSIQDAIRQARQELGSDAMLLNSRRVNGAGNAADGEQRDGNAPPKNGADDNVVFAVTFATAAPPPRESAGSGKTDGYTRGGVAVTSTDSQTTAAGLASPRAGARSSRAHDGVNGTAVATGSCTQDREPSYANGSGRGSLPVEGAPLRAGGRRDADGGGRRDVDGASRRDADGASRRDVDGAGRRDVDGASGRAQAVRRATPPTESAAGTNRTGEIHPKDAGRYETGRYETGQNRSEPLRDTLENRYETSDGLAPTWHGEQPSSELGHAVSGGRAATRAPLHDGRVSDGDDRSAARKGARLDRMAEQDQDDEFRESVAGTPLRDGESGGSYSVKPADTSLPSYDKLFEQMTSMRREMLNLAGSVRRASAVNYRQDLPGDHLRWAYDVLVAQEFYPELIEDVIEQLQPRLAVAEETRPQQAKGRARRRSASAERDPATGVLPLLREALAAHIELTPEPSLRRRGASPQLVVLVGPPGVGKTTTLVKLAARYGLSSRFALQVISMDNYRVGASEQLRTYASVLGVGFDALPSTSSLERALREYQAKELILIDTPGYGWRDFPAADDLAALIREQSRASVHLAVSASMKASDLARVADLYEVFGYRSILFTKLDETCTVGPLVSEASLRGKPLSYLCAGQRIPDDLEVASRERILERILPASLSTGEFAA